MAKSQGVHLGYPVGQSATSKEQREEDIKQRKGKNKRETQKQKDGREWPSVKRTLHLIAKKNSCTHSCYAGMCRYRFKVEWKQTILCYVAIIW